MKVVTARQYAERDLLRPCLCVGFPLSPHGRLDAVRDARDR